MQKRTILAGLQGMNQDVVNPAINQKQAFEIKNFRFNSTANSNSIELTTEKSTLEVPIYENGQLVPQIGQNIPTYTSNDRGLPATHKSIGYCILNNYLTVFMCGLNGNYDEIKRLELKLNSGGYYFEQILLYQGILSFDENSQIESIPCYENDKIQKIYWIDGVNYPRVMNISRTYIDSNDNEVIGYGDYDVDEDPFCFYQIIHSGEFNNITVNKLFIGGLFYAGVIQYAFSFYNTNALETPIIYITPLNYVSHSDRGEEENKQLGCSFELTLKINKDDAENFDYIRVYQIYRTSIDGTPVVKVIKDIKCSEMNKSIINGNNISVVTQNDRLSIFDCYTAKIVDDNQSGYDFDAYKLLVNNDYIKPNAIVTKDNKMFLGNYISDFDIVDYMTLYSSGSDIVWQCDTDKLIQIVDTNAESYYNYVNQIGTTNSTSEKITTFKRGEYYKFGLQFLDKYGKWSTPYLIGTSQNNQYPVQDIYNGTANLPYAKYSKTISLIYSLLSDKEYIKVRPVISFPTLSERNVLCQGVLNPTVFNISDRLNKVCHGYSSWFFRPTKNTLNPTDNIINDVDFDYTTGQNGGVVVNYKHLQSVFDSTNKGGEILGIYYDDWISNLKTTRWIASQSQDPYVLLENCNKFNLFFNTTPASGSLVSIRSNINADCIDNSNLDKYRNNFYIDRSLITLNSPDIEFNDNFSNIDINNYKLKIVGCIQFDSNSGNYRIIALNPLFYSDIYKGVQAEIVDGTDHLNITKRGSSLALGFLYLNLLYNNNLNSSILCALNCWIDDYSGFYRAEGGNASWVRANTTVLTSSGHDDFNINTTLHYRSNWGEREKAFFAYTVYPWQRLYLNNYKPNARSINYGTENINIGCEDTIESSKITKKILSNLRYSNNTIYFDNNYILNNNNSCIPNLNTIKIFNRDDSGYVKLNSDILYSGNVDKLLTYESNYNGFAFDVNDEITINSSKLENYDITNKLTGYPINAWFYKKSWYLQGYFESSMLKSPLIPIEVYRYGSGIYRDYGIEPGTNFETYKLILGDSNNSTDPILMRYKSSPHVIIQLGNYSNTLNISTIPVITGSTNNNHIDIHYQGTPGWNVGNSNYYTIPFLNASNLSGIDNYLLIADLYKEENNGYINDNKFDVIQRTWIPAGKEYEFDQNNSEYIKWTEGDTYYQRYDCLKTLLFSEEDYQSVVEIASFMCETHINLDGRYDTNRGLIDNTYVNSKNFNLINNVYGLKNNFFSYQIIDNEKYINEFPTRITWSLNKVNSLDVDEWTRTNSAAFLDLDGDKGKLTSLRRFNNQIYAFQQSGISRIKYNENVALSTNNGIPIELANSLSVNGKDYISENVGSLNKWSCISTPSGIYFVDNHTSGIYKLGVGLNGMSLNNITKDVIQRWFETNNNSLNNFIYNTSYDANTDEVLFMFNQYQNNTSLAYQDRYGVFSSFYDYQGFVDNIGKHSLNIYNNKIYFLREGGSYNNFYGYIKNNWITFTANPAIDGLIVSDCIFDNVWYKGDVLNTTLSDNINNNELIQNSEVVNSNWNHTFNKISVGNDYQYSEASGQDARFIKKFRMWRVPIPRQNRARMRNSWLRIKLEDTAPVTSKTIIKEIYVDAFC